MTQTSDMQAYRESPEGIERVARLFALVPDRGSSALDVGARDGYISLMLAERFERVVALDLSPPTIEHPSVECVPGNSVQGLFTPWQSNWIHMRLDKQPKRSVQSGSHL